MGTNYFAHIIPSMEKKKKLTELIINSTNFREIMDLTSEMFGYFDEYSHTGGIIHLGKRSGGWKFLWDPNIYRIRNGHTEPVEVEPGHIKHNWVKDPDTSFMLYPLTKEGIKNFIDREDIEIYDEYRRLQNKEEFFKMALDWIDWNGKEAWDGESYEKEHPSKFNYHTEYCDFLSSLGYNIKWPWTDFYNDGLRFSTSTNFS